MSTYGVNVVPIRSNLRVHIKAVIRGYARGHVWRVTSHAWVNDYTHRYPDDNTE